MAFSPTDNGCTDEERAAALCWYLFVAVKLTNTNSGRTTYRYFWSVRYET